MFLWFPVLDLARAPRRTARKKGSGYENGKTLAGAGHVSHGNLIAQGGVDKVSNYMLPLSNFTLLLQVVSVLYRSTLRIIYTCQI